MSQEGVYYVGMDIHKEIIAYCVKNDRGETIMHGDIAANKKSLLLWEQELPHPWIGAMEATMFTGWIYDTLRPYAKELITANPLMMKAISSAKKKNDATDAEKLSDMLRIDYIPRCYMAPSDIRELRRVLRFRNFFVRHCTALKNKNASMLMECGVEYSKKRLHGKRYFKNLLETLEEVPPSLSSLLTINKDVIDQMSKVQRLLVKGLQETKLLKERAERLMTIPGVGEVLALTWALEIAEPERFSSIRKAISYCGLCSAQKESAGKRQRGPISKQRNEHIQWILVEAAKIAVRYNQSLAKVYAHEAVKGGRNRATLAVARKLVAYLLAVDKSGRPFEDRQAQKMEKETGEGRAPSLS